MVQNPFVTLSPADSALRGTMLAACSSPRGLHSGTWPGWPPHSSSRGISPPSSWCCSCHHCFPPTSTGVLEPFGTQKPPQTTLVALNNGGKFFTCRVWELQRSLILAWPFTHTPNSRPPNTRHPHKALSPSVPVCSPPCRDDSQLLVHGFTHPPPL